MGAVIAASNIICFLIGAKVGQAVSKGEKVEMPTINPFEAYKEREAKKEADKALSSLKGLKGFDLWHAFSALSITTGEGDNAKVTQSTINTAFTKDGITDDALETWLFADERKSGNVKVIKGTDGYYLAYFYTSEETWTRKAKDSWVEEQMKEHLKELCKGYTVEEKVLNKIKKPEDMTTTAAPKK